MRVLYRPLFFWDLRPSGYKENFYCIPDEDTMYSFDYIFIPLKFMKYQLEKMWINDSELKKILEIDVKDIINEWILTSKFKDDCFNLAEYKYIYDMLNYFNFNQFIEQYNVFPLDVVVVLIY